MRSIFTFVALCCGITSFAQIGDWLADQIKQQIQSEISSITNYNSNNLGTFGSFLWEAVVESKCESDLNEKAQEFKNFKINQWYLDRVPEKYPGRNVWSSYPQVSTLLNNKANSYFHQTRNIRFSDAANATFNTQLSDI